MSAHPVLLAVRMSDGRCAVITGDLTLATASRAGLAGRIHDIAEAVELGRDVPIRDVLAGLPAGRGQALDAGQIELILRAFGRGVS